jgi:CubicO group peptidase (beta-lactamase class C family)
LHWTPEQQREGYRSIETIYKTATIARGKAVRALGNADRTLELSYTRDGRNWTIDDFMKAFDVSGLMVLKDGKVLVERYGLGRQPQDRWISFSVAKSVTSTLAGAAIQDGKIKSLDEPVTLYIPELKGSGYDGVNLRQMLTMSSGVQWNEDYSDPNADVAHSGTTYNEPGVNPIVSTCAACRARTSRARRSTTTPARPVSSAWWCRR